MDRMMEYRALMAQLDQTPPELEFTVTRARARARRRRAGRLFGIPAASLAGVFAAFVLLVNTSVTFANACAALPVLGPLTRAVCFSHSLSAAVEHDYVQPIGQSQTADGITLTINSVIVDQRQLNVFYTVDSQLPDHAYARLVCDVLAPGLTGYSIYYGSPAPVGETDYFTLDFQSAEMPGLLDVELSLRMLPDLQAAAQVGPADARFSFRLEFDPAFTAQGEVIPLEQSMVLDGQTIHLDRLEIYPTHTRLFFRGDAANDWTLTDLSFYLEDGEGTCYQTEGGISGRGDGSGGWLERRVSSPWFSESGSLTLFITGAGWLDEEHSAVTVDLTAGTAQGLPEGLTLERVKRDENDPDRLTLLFRGIAPPEGEALSIPFALRYLDPSGQSHDIVSSGSGVNGDGTSSFHLMLEDCPYDAVTLQMRETGYSRPDAPVEISVK